MKSSTGFPQIPLLVFVGILIISALLSGAAQKWWDVKSCTEWSIEEVDEMINDSPWVKYSPASPVFTENKQVINPATGGSRGGHRDLAMYAIRMITAQPMREAYLRRLSFSELGIAVDSKRLRDEKSRESQLDRLQYLIQSHPDDVLVKGDREHIILDISWSIRTQYSSTGQFARGVEMPLPENLRELRLSELGPVTSLSTDAKRRVLPVRCEYVNYMSIRLYFPRVLANGQSLIDKADKKLWFETRLGTAKITVKFDLPKMMRQGRIET